MGGSVADNNLLFGVLALQMDFIEQSQLIAGMQAWMNEKHVSLAEHLTRMGALQTHDRLVLEPLIAAHLRRHGNDPEKSLAAISSVTEIWRSLSLVKDADLQQSLRHLVRPETKFNHDPARTIYSNTTQTTSTRFKVLRPHARGGLGEVFVAHDTELLREVALKEIQVGKDDGDNRARFMREAEITGSLEHPGIVPIYSLGTNPDGRPFYAMRFIRGQSLQEAIRDYHQGLVSESSTSGGRTVTQTSTTSRSLNKSQRNLQLRQLLQRFIDVCEAVHYAHSRGVLHRDLKPGNIMLGRYGETLVVDWGLAKIADQATEPATNSDSTLTLEPKIKSSEASATVIGSALGTPAYMPPEQAEGRLDLLCPASDVYSLGATLYCILTGQPPITGKNLSEVMKNVQRGSITPPRNLSHDVTKPLEAICLKALARPISQRYSTARQLAAELERYLADEPVEALPESVWTRASRWGRRNRQWMLAGVITLLAVAGASIGAYLYQRETATQNLRLAVEKGRLAEEKSELAVKETQSRQAAEANYVKLRSALTDHYFAQGNNEFYSGHINSAMLELQRAWVLSIEENAASRSGYAEVILDRYFGGGRYVGLPLRHDARVTAVAYSPKGDRVLTGSDDKTAQLWDAKTGAIVGPPLKHESAVLSVAFSPQGDRAATGAMDGIRFWDVASGLMLGQPIKYDGVKSMAFSPDGGKLVAGGYDKVVRILDANTGTALCDAIQHPHVVLAVAFHPSGQRVVTTCLDGNARLWDAHNGTSVGVAMRHGGPVSAVAFSAQGDRLLTGGWDRTAKWWNAETQAPLSIAIQMDEPVQELAFSPLGDQVFILTSDQIVRSWSAETGALGEPLGRTPVRAFAFSPQGDRFLFCGYDNTARIWDLQYDQPQVLTMQHEDGIDCVAFSPQGDRVVTGGWDNSARIWNADDGTALGVPLRHDGRVMVVVFSPDGDRVLTGGTDRTARMWNAYTGEALGKPLLHKSAISSVAFSPDGKIFLTGTNDDSVHLWDSATQTELPMDKSPCWVNTAIFSPKGDRILVGSVQAEAWLWDIRSHSRLDIPQAHRDQVVSLAFSPQGDRLLTGSKDMTAAIWDSQTLMPVGARLHHEGDVVSVAFSPNGQRVLTGSVDKTARLWDARTGEPIGQPMWHEAALTQVAFSPQGDRVLTASLDNTARVWDAQTGAPVGHPMRHGDQVSAIAFSPSGESILTGAWDRTAQLWHSTQPPTPANLLLHLEWGTGYHVTKGTGTTPFQPGERLELAQKLAGDESWLTEVKTWNETRERRYHTLALQREMSKFVPNRLVARFHLHWLAQIDASTAEQWEKQLEARMKALPDRRLWKNTTNEFVQISVTKWVEKANDGGQFQFIERDRHTDYVELFDKTRKIAVRLYANKVMLQEAGSDYRLLYNNGGWKE